MGKALIGVTEVSVGLSEFHVTSNTVLMYGKDELTSRVTSAGDLCTCEIVA